MTMIGRLVDAIVVEKEEDAKLLEQYGYVLRGTLTRKSKITTWLYSADDEEEAEVWANRRRHE